MLPHPDKLFKGGEDYLYQHPQMLIIADGVGGWSEYGIDPGQYSYEYCTNCGKIFEE